MTRLDPLLVMTDFVGEQTSGACWLEATYAPRGPGMDVPAAPECPIWSGPLRDAWKALVGIGGEAPSVIRSAHTTWRLVSARVLRMSGLRGAQGLVLRYETPEEPVLS